jgi:hypothetical protein
MIRNCAAVQDLLIIWLSPQRRARLRKGPIWAQPRLKPPRSFRIHTRMHTCDALRTGARRSAPHRRAVCPAVQDRLHLPPPNASDVSGRDEGGEDMRRRRASECAHRSHPGFPRAISQSEEGKPSSESEEGLLPQWTLEGMRRTHEATAGVGRERSAEPRPG